MPEKGRHKEIRAALAERRHKMDDYGIMLEDLRKAMAGKRTKKPGAKTRRSVAPKHRSLESGAT